MASIEFKAYLAMSEMCEGAELSYRADMRQALFQVAGLKG